ncbi:Molybdenum cofactor cytidylyltransferase [Planctomycetales bacterium 10988]|nr:Molybdenum cofactor cytidylyltransferase [Planctomycetales bacterium 10988]
MNIGLLLAAGGSSRLGKPKQLLSWQGKTLVEHTACQLQSAGCQAVIVIFGAYESQIRKALLNSSQPLTLLTNPDWEEGQATSLRFGLKSLSEHYPQTQRVLIALCDQPLITPEEYGQLISLATEHRCMTATNYPSGAGVPACIPFPECSSLLDSLQGDQGAKHWLRARSPQSIQLLDLPTARLDLDTTEDYQKLLKQISRSNNKVSEN